MLGEEEVDVFNAIFASVEAVGENARAMTTSDSPRVPGPHHHSAVDDLRQLARPSGRPGT